jgi:CheY-like chemotaxis protein/signal transduction histidine kinase
LTVAGTIWQDDVRRQVERLDADLVARHAVIFLTFVIVAFPLPFWLIFFCYIGVLLTDIAQYRILAILEKNSTALWRVTLLLAGALENFIFLIPAIVVWVIGDDLMRFVVFLAVVGSLLNASSVRSACVAYGFASMVPGIAITLWMPWAGRWHDASALGSALALAGSIGLLGYFVSALFQNNRAQHELAAMVEKVREASAAKSRFLTAMNHEVRTPLNALLGHSQLLRDTADLAEARTHAAQIEIAARSMETLVEDVVDLTAAAEGRLQFRPTTVAIRSEIARLERQPLAVAGVPTPVIRPEIADEVPEFGRFDPVLLRKCLTHLASAVLSERSGPGLAELTIRCALAPGRKDRLRFTLAAHGAEGSARGKPATIKADPGPAPEIASALLDSIARVMGANTAVLRAPDQTLVARIELPFIMVAEPPATGAEAVYGRLRTLVVDDIASNRLVVAQLLRSLRIEATEVSGGQEALDSLGDSDYDLVLLDMNMPDMDGEATLQAIRSSTRDWAGIPVVALTADTLGSQRDHYLRIGLNGFLTKPLDRRALWSEILSACPPPPPL